MNQMRTHLTRCRVSPNHVTIQADHQSPCRRKAGNGTKEGSSLQQFLDASNLIRATRTRRYTSSRHDITEKCKYSNKPRVPRPSSLSCPPLSLFCHQHVNNNNNNNNLCTNYIVQRCCLYPPDRGLVQDSLPERPGHNLHPRWPFRGRAPCLSGRVLW